VVAGQLAAPVLKRRQIALLNINVEQVEDKDRTKSNDVSAGGSQLESSKMTQCHQSEAPNGCPLNMEKTASVDSPPGRSGGRNRSSKM
jgi:hypothetical protein